MAEAACLTELAMSRVRAVRLAAVTDVALAKEVELVALDGAGAGVVASVVDEVAALADVSSLSCSLSEYNVGSDIHTLTK